MEIKFWTKLPGQQARGIIPASYDNRGIRRAASTGEVVWQQRLGGRFSASPVFADGRIYCVGDNGETTVLAAGPQLEVLARNPLDEKVQASPAISGGRIFIRTERHLLAVGR